jgi:uncharacterized protein (DUF488 family)
LVAAERRLTRITLIGYGGSKPTDFFAKIEQLNPDIVVDVREDPYHAYLATYTKPRLEKRLASKYVWIPELGNKTRDINNIHLVDEQKGLQKLLELARRNDHIKLLCAEKKDEDCHRSYVRNRLYALLTGTSNRVSQEEG